MTVDAAALALSAPQPRAPFNPFRLRLLVLEADDHEFGRLALQLAAERPRVEICRATDLDGARNILLERRLDAVLLRIDPSGGAGVGALTNARDTFPDLPLIVLGPTSDLMLSLHTIQNGAADYVDAASLGASGLARRIIFAKERFAAEHEVRRRNMLLQTMIAMLGHDLRAPPRQIASLCDSIDASLQPETRAEIAGAVAGIRDRCRHMKSILDETMEYAKYAAKTPAKSVHTLSSALAPVCQDLEPEARARVTLVQDGPIWADPKLMFHILRNLIENSLTYWRDTPSTVTLSTDIAGPQTTITISDTGMGMPDHLSPRVFEPAVRGVAAGDFPGTGFGLSIVRHLIEAHGGTVALVSELGRGTDVTLTLPFTQMRSV